MKNDKINVETDNVASHNVHSHIRLTLQYAELAPQYSK